MLVCLLHKIGNDTSFNSWKYRRVIMNFINENIKMLDQLYTEANTIIKHRIQNDLLDKKFFLLETSL